MVRRYCRSPGILKPLETATRPLDSQIAFVTGASKGIGAAIAERLASLGATVILCGRTAALLEQIGKKIRGGGGKAEEVVCDVTARGSVEAAAEWVGKNHGHIDILVNNAGVGVFGRPLHKMPPESWDAIFNTNLRGVYYCIRSFAPMMIRAGRGHIINISSIAGKNAVLNGAAYSASKWGLNGLTYSVAEELRGHNIRVSVICPGSVATEFSPHTGKDSSKMLDPEDVAHAVAMLVTQAPNSFTSEIVLRPTQKP